jgi:16S rRNA (uracil1498-N3)-methyltransferase
MHRSVVKLDQKKGSKRIGRFATIARNAAMQSGRTSIPSIEPIQSLENLAATWTSADEIFLFWEEASQKQTIASAFQSLIETKRLQSVQQIWVIVGPEGGISPDEVALIKQSRANVHQLSLGPSILRTETAGIVATALVINELRRVSGWAD